MGFRRGRQKLILSTSSSRTHVDVRSLNTDPSTPMLEAGEKNLQLDQDS